MAVVIGIPTPTWGDLEYNRRSWPAYSGAVQAAGAEVRAIDLGWTVAERRAAAALCDGFVLPGSPADVDPDRYGQGREPDTAAADPAREDCDRALLEHATDTGKPVLAICFGMQHLNVWRGGTLVQDLTPMPINHAAGVGVAVAHSVLVSSASLLGSLLTAAEAPADDGFRRLPVNTSHHQAVAAPGDELAVVARSAEDGVIEGVEARIGEAVMLGVQWHPERSVDISPASRALFTWLVSEADDRQMRAEDAGVGDL